MPPCLVARPMGDNLYTIVVRDFANNTVISSADVRVYADGVLLATTHMDSPDRTGDQHGSHSCYGIVNPVLKRTWGSAKAFYR